MDIFASGYMHALSVLCTPARSNFGSSDINRVLRSTDAMVCNCPEEEIAFSIDAKYMNRIQSALLEAQTETGTMIHIDQDVWGHGACRIRGPLCQIYRAHHYLIMQKQDCLANSSAEESNEEVVDTEDELISLTPRATAAADSLFTFGRHKGKSFKQVTEEHFEYYNWCTENIENGPKTRQRELRAYINWVEQCYVPPERVD